MGTVMRTRVALLVVDVELLKVSLVVRAQVLVMNLPAPKRNPKKMSNVVSISSVDGQGGRILFVMGAHFFTF